MRETGEGNGRRKGRGRGKEWKVTGRGNLLPLKFRSGYATDIPQRQVSVSQFTFTNVTYQMLLVLL